jgi:hypothetical protein
MEKLPSPSQRHPLKFTTGTAQLNSKVLAPIRKGRNAECKHVITRSANKAPTRYQQGTDKIQLALING